MHTCNCVKCKKQYQSEEPDNYFCEDCYKIRKQVADEIDAKMANRPKKKIVSDLQQFEMVAKKRGSIDFANAKDLGLL